MALEYDCARWLQVARGRSFNYLNPRPEDFNIEEIATALARQTRFAGHMRMDYPEIYSVAQHSVLVAKLADNKLAGLLHDVHEFVLGDMGTPLKCLYDDLVPGFRKTQNRISDLIDQWVCDCIHFDVRELHSQAIKQADLKALATEKRDIMAACENPWLPLPEPDTEIIQPMTWQQARDAFLECYYTCPFETFTENA